MKKLKKQSRTLSIWGGIMFILLALNNISYMFEYFSDRMEYYTSSQFDFYLPFEMCLFIAVYITIAVILFVNKSYSGLIFPSVVLLIKDLCNLINYYIPSWKDLSDSSLQRFIDAKQFDKAFTYIGNNIINPLLTVVTSIFIIVAICLALSKKTDAIKRAWLVPVIMYGPVMLISVWFNAKELSEIFERVDKYSTSKFIERYSESISMNVESIMFSCIFFAGILLMCLWLKSKNSILRGEIQYQAPQPQYHVPVEPQYQAPQPQYNAPVEPQYQAPQPQYQAPVEPQYQAPQPQYQAPVEPQTQKLNNDDIERLKQLKDLLDSGILSQEEFDQKKKEILDL